MPIRTNRILVPFGKRKSMAKGFVNVKIYNAGKSSEFLYKFNDDERITIPKGVREELGLNDGQITRVKINEIEDVPRPDAQFIGRLFDSLHYVPNRTISGYQIVARPHGSRWTLWYSAKGRPNEVEINKRVGLDFARFLGYYQAEGGKIKLHERRGREASITNKSMKIIGDTIALSKRMFPASMWSATVFYNKKVGHEEIERVKKHLEILGVECDKIKDRAADRIAEYTIKLWITNSVLGETIFNFMNKVRKHLIECDLSEGYNLKIYNEFVRGLLAGDGSLNCHRDKNGSLHKRLSIFDSNEKFVNDYSKLLEKIGIIGTIRKDPRKNLYIYSASLNWASMTTLRNLSLLIMPNHKEHLARAMKDQKRILKKHSGATLWPARIRAQLISSRPLP